LVALAPEVIVAFSVTYLDALLQATRTVPIVFASVTDPVGAGLIESMARPGGNATGFVVIQSVAPALGVDVTAINLRHAGDIERAVTAFAGTPNGGLILTASALAGRIAN
jgi:putative ABC transport system substrate-binding protein